METVNKPVDSGAKRFKNPIQQMIEDKKRVIEAIKKGQNISTLVGIKVVSPL